MTDSRRRTARVHPAVAIGLVVAATLTSVVGVRGVSGYSVVPTST